MKRKGPVHHNLTAAMLIIFLSTILAGSTILLIHTYDAVKHDQDLAFENKVHTFSHIIDAELINIDENLQMSLDLLLVNNEIVEMFARRNRQALLDKTLQFYRSTLEGEYHIVQFQFHLPDSSSFLRIHTPETHGDDLSSFRHTVVLANESGMTISGIEVGRAGLGYRVVKPIYFSDKQIGTVEFGADLQAAISIAETITGLEYAIGITEQTIIRSRQFELQSDIRVNDMIFYPSSARDWPKLAAYLNGRKSLTGYFTVNSVTYRTAYIPLYDFSGREIGRIMLLDSQNEENAALWQRISDQLILLLIINIAITVILLLLLYLFIIRPLRKVVRKISGRDGDPLKTGRTAAPGTEDEDFIDKSSSRFALNIERIIQDLQSVMNEKSQLYNTMTQEYRKTLSCLERQKSHLLKNQALGSLGTLMGNVAHELNTPLGVAVTASSSLYERIEKLQDSFSHENISKQELESFFSLADELKSILSTNLSRASSLITSFSRVSSQRSWGKIRQVNLFRYVRFIYGTVYPQVINRNVRMINKVSRDIVCRIHVEALFQILWNLIMNSLTHGFSHIRTNGEIVIEAGRTGEGIELEYRDNGVGMDSETLEKIYQPYFTTSDKQTNPGLGMAIVHNLVTDILDGRIETRSRPDDGIQVRMIFQNARGVPKDLALHQ